MERLPSYILSLIEKNDFYTTKHFRERVIERNLDFVDIKKALMGGEVISEDLYLENSIKKEKYVVYCYQKNQPFHTVVLYEGKVYLKTIYIPDNRFQADGKRRNKGR